jgi:hypothetical protein
VLDELVAVPAFDAERAFIDGMITAWGNAGDDIILDVQEKAAAAAAPGADGGNFVHTLVL